MVTTLKTARELVPAADPSIRRSLDKRSDASLEIVMKAPGLPARALVTDAKELVKNDMDGMAIQQ